MHGKGQEDDFGQTLVNREQGSGEEAYRYEPGHFVEHTASLVQVASEAQPSIHAPVSDGIERVIEIDYATCGKSGTR